MARFNENYFDDLTGLANKRFIEENYHNYINTHNDARFVMIDFTKFKKINDSYGHDMGDKCLVIFANKIRNYFKDSIYARLHGDEFVIITYLDDERISNILKLVEYSIEKEVKKGSIPFKFGFNAGSAICTDKMEEVAEKADYMMYCAKQNKINYQPYDEDLYSVKVNEFNLKEDFSKQLEEEKFTYYGRNMYNVSSEETENIQIYTKDENGNSFFNNQLYNIIRNNKEIVEFDLYNLRTLVEKLSMTCSKGLYFINIDYRSLYSLNELLIFFEYIKSSTLNGLNNIVLSIDISGIESKEYDVALDIISLLRNLGIKINIDKVDCYLSDYFLMASRPNYVKISHLFWKQAQENGFTKMVLASKLDTYKLMGSNTKIIYDRVIEDKDFEFLKEISPCDSLLSGDYYAKERKLTLD